MKFSRALCQHTLYFLFLRFQLQYVPARIAQLLIIAPYKQRLNCYTMGDQLKAGADAEPYKIILFVIYK